MKHRVNDPRRSTRHATPSVTEWVLARVTAPVYVKQDMGKPAVRPDMLVCCEAGSGVLLAAEMLPPDASMERAFDVLRKAMEAPLNGPPHRPASLRVDDAFLAGQIAQRFGLSARQGAVPEADAFAASFARELDRNPRPIDTLAAPPGYLDAGASPGEVAALFRASAELYRAAIWETIDDDNLVRLDIPGVGLHGHFASVIGAMGESFGVVVFDSLQAFYHFQRFGPAGDGPKKLLSPLLVLNFEPVDSVVPSMSAEQREHGWDLASLNAFPMVQTVDADQVPRPLDRDQVMKCSAIAEALVLFWRQHGGAWEAEENPRATIELSHLTEPMTATLAAQCTKPSLLPVVDEDDPKELFPTVIHKLFAFVRDDRKLAGELEAAETFFWCAQPPDWDNLTDYEHNVMKARFLEWFALQRVSRSYGETPVSTFLRRARLSPKLSALAKLLPRNKLGIFEVVDVVLDESLTLRDMDGKLMQVRERLATRDLRTGAVLIGRVFLLGEGTWTISGCIHALPTVPVENLRTGWTLVCRQANGTAPSQRDLDMLLRGPSELQAPPELPASELERRLRHACKRARIAQSIASLKKAIRRATTPLDVLRQLGAEMEISDEEIVCELQMLIMCLWNATPRPELHDKSPHQVNAANPTSPGMEMARAEKRRFVNEFIQYAESNNLRDRCADNEESARAFIAEEMRHWMLRARDDLGGLSPAEVIARNRAAVDKERACRESHVSSD